MMIRKCKLEQYNNLSKYGRNHKNATQNRYLITGHKLTPTCLCNIIYDRMMQLTLLPSRYLKSVIHIN